MSLSLFIPTQRHPDKEIVRATAFPWWCFNSAHIRQILWSPSFQVTWWVINTSQKENIPRARNCPDVTISTISLVFDFFFWIKCPFHQTPARGRHTLDTVSCQGSSNIKCYQKEFVLVNEFEEKGDISETHPLNVANLTNRDRLKVSKAKCQFWNFIKFANVSCVAVFLCLVGLDWDIR